MTLALGDSFALATAAQLAATFLTGDDFAEVTDVSTERFRDGSSRW